jgi:hypothetical protein
MVFGGVVANRGAEGFARGAVDRDVGTVVVVDVELVLDAVDVVDIEGDDVEMDNELVVTTACADPAG